MNILPLKLHIMIELCMMNNLLIIKKVLDTFLMKYLIHDNLFTVYSLLIRNIIFHIFYLFIFFVKIDFHMLNRNLNIFL